jgi:hypothetical protein
VLGSRRVFSSEPGINAGQLTLFRAYRNVDFRIVFERNAAWPKILFKRDRGSEIFFSFGLAALEFFSRIMSLVR